MTFAVFMLPEDWPANAHSPWCICTRCDAARKARGVDPTKDLSEPLVFDEESKENN